MDNENTNRAIEGVSSNNSKPLTEAHRELIRFMAEVVVQDIIDNRISSIEDDGDASM